MQPQSLIWQPYDALEATVPLNLRAWLSHPGSFMKRLHQYESEHARINLLSQRWQFPMRDEKEKLGSAPRSYCLVREVLIASEGKKWMFARTIFPRETLTGKQKQLSRLKMRSLGSVLFKDPSLQRSGFEITCLRPGDAWHTVIANQAKIKNKTFWARRSIFTIQGKPLLLTEVFLPDIATVCK